MQGKKAQHGRERHKKLETMQDVGMMYIRGARGTLYRREGRKYLVTG